MASEVNPKVEAFFAGAKSWHAELAALRSILLGCPVTEEFKWRGPVYTFDGGNVATLWGLKDYCALSFFKGVLLKDAEDILMAPGENSRSVRLVKLTSTAEIARKKAVLRAYVIEAIEVEKAGLKVDLPKDDLDFPAELVLTFDNDPDFRDAFKALTPGRQRGYLLFFAQPKQSRTRVSRIEKSRPRILDGKGRHDR